MQESAATRWDLYRVIAEPFRLRLLALAAEEELTIGELAEVLNESQPNVSRHVAPLRQAGLVTLRKQGTRSLVSIRDEVRRDPVVADALASGRGLCIADGSLGRIQEVVRARDAEARAYFATARKDRDAQARPPSELGAYLTALSLLLPRHELAIDAGTGEGGLLDVLAPSFTKVIAFDRSEAQLERARERVALRRFTNVDMIAGEVDGPEIARAARASGGADAVFAVRMLHHAPRPQAMLEALFALTHEQGAVLVVDYAAHDDEFMREHADLWLGFEGAELERMARAAGFAQAVVTSIPPAMLGIHAGVPGPESPDAHLPWQVLVAKKSRASHATKGTRK